MPERDGTDLQIDTEIRHAHDVALDVRDLLSARPARLGSPPERHLRRTGRPSPLSCDQTPPRLVAAGPAPSTKHTIARSAGSALV
jgi:hypothetical protein